MLTKTSIRHNTYCFYSFSIKYGNYIELSNILVRYDFLLILQYKIVL